MYQGIYRFSFSIKKVLCVMLVACIVVYNLMAVGVFALLQRSVDNTFAEVEGVINMYATDETVNYTVSDYKALKSPSGNDDAYTLYALEPYGYAILLNDGNDLMEANYSEGAVLPIAVDSLLDCYYGGPGVYYSSENSRFVNIATEQVLGVNEIAGIIDAEKHVRATSNLIRTSSGSNSRATTSTTPYVVEQSYFANLNNHGINVNGTCTVVAACILLRYYDYFISDSYVASGYESGSGTTNAFHELLNDYVYGSEPEGGIFIRNASAGINQYLDSRYISVDMVHIHSSQTSVLSTMNTMLSSGTPVVASFWNQLPDNAPDYINHSVVVYGVQFTASNPIETAKYTCHMGWYSADNATVIDGNWFYECGWFECSLTSHSYSGRCKAVNALRHKTYCPCGMYTTSPHTWHVDASGGGAHCTVCNYVRTNLASIEEELVVIS